MTNMYHSRSKTLLSAAVECLLYKRGRKSTINDTVENLRKSLARMFPKEPWCYSILKINEQYTLPLERASMVMKPWPRLEVILMDKREFWFDQPPYFILPPEPKGVSRVYVPVNRKSLKRTPLRHCFG